MASLPPLSHVAVTVPAEESTAAVHAILAAIRPDWQPKDVHVKVMSQGYANRLLRCSVEGEAERLMVRVYGQNPGIGNCYNRASELDVLRVLAHEGVNTSIHCRFENGFVYGFANGHTLRREDLKDEGVRRSILELLHRVHGIDYAGYVGKVARPGILSFVDEPWKVVDDSDFTQIEADPRYVASLPPVDDLRRIRQEVHEIYDDLCKVYPVVYSHGDLHVHNIVLDKAADKLVFIDWEDSNWCPEILDPTTLFDRDPEFSGVFGAREDRRTVLREYLALHPVHGAAAVVPDAVLDQWYRDSVRMSLVTSFVVISFCLVSLKTDQASDVDYFEFGSTFYKLHMQYRAELNSLPKPT